MPNQKVLIVDDEPDILELVKYNLAREGYIVKCAASGERGLSLALEDVPDLVVLDLMLPGIDGLEVCRALRADPSTAQVSILMLTAKTEDSDIVAGLELGADDYITKPFSPRVLLARIKATLRRRARMTETDGHGVMKLHEVTIDPDRYEVLVQDQPVTLTATEFAILKFLARRPGRVYSRTQIIAAVRGEDYAVTDRAVDVTVVGLRKKLGHAGRLI
ncbi:MAG: response regulator transcription factor, partial [Pseudomonadota bacterium]